MPRIELGSLDSESKVLTITPQNFEGLWIHIIEQKWLPFACDSVAEWSKALVLGTSHSDDAGSNPTTASCSTIFQVSVSKILIHFIIEFF